MPRKARRRQLRNAGVRIAYPPNFTELMPEASPKTWSKRQDHRRESIDRIKSSFPFRLAAISGADRELLVAPDPERLVSKRQWWILTQQWHRKLRKWCEKNFGKPISL